MFAFGNVSGGGLCCTSSFAGVGTDNKGRKEIGRDLLMSLAKLVSTCVIDGKECWVCLSLTSAETREVVGLGGPGGEASLAGFGVSPNPPIPQNVLGFCTRLFAGRSLVLSLTREVVGLGCPGGEASLAGFGVSPNPPIPQNVLGFCTRLFVGRSLVLSLLVAVGTQ